ncbi:outer membrane lipoprotein-sorting protein [Bdellovibrio sp. HCB337]|uniref:outer membrane lipoprotein-sorting protein n=1 Tax=Bdellovibrio sp. HCB337 TaxID=3394358 RepID=UPI0039A530CB
MTNQLLGKDKLPVFVKRVCISILLAMGALTVLSVFTFSNLQTQYSLSQFLPKQNPLLALDAKAKRTFQISESQPFIVTLQLTDKTQNWLDVDKIQILKQTTEELRQLEGVKNTLSLATVEGAINSKEGLSVGPLLASIPPEKWIQQVVKNTMLSPALISKDLRTASLVVYIKELPNNALQELKTHIESIAQKNLEFAKVEMGGTPAVQSDISVLLQSEIRNFVGLGFLACLIVLSIVFANITPVLISFVITLVANLMILAAMAILGYSFTVLSTTIPILATITVMSLCIHSMLRLVEEEKLGPPLPHYKSVLRTMRVLLGANFLAALTPMIGFLSLATTKVPLIKDFGITVAMAIFICWIVSNALLVPLMILLPKPQARKWAWAKARWGLYFFRKSGVVALLIIVVSVGLAIKGQKLSWTARLFDDLPTDHQVRNSTEIIDRKLGGMIPIDIELRGTQDIWGDPKLLAKLDSLIHHYRKYPGVGSAVGLPDLVAASNLTRSRLPASKASTAEILFLYSLSDQSPLKNYLSTDSARTRIALRAQDLPSNELARLVDNLVHEAHVKFPGFKVTATGMGSTIHTLNNQLSKELIFGFWHAMIAIFLILIVVFRSVRWSFVACIPNLVPPAVLLGFLAISQTPIKPSIAIIFSIALGLAFNNTVYFLERLRSIQRNSSINKLDVEKALWLEGNPCLISSLTLLAGFSVFLVSYFAMNRTFGFYMVLSMIAGLVGDLILLPTLIKSCPWLLTNPKLPDATKEKFMAALSAVCFAFLLFGSPTSARAAIPPMSVDKIAQEISTRMSAKDEEFDASMKIVEADKSSKERAMKIMRLSPNKKEHYVMVRMQTPKDLKGTSLLATYKEGKEEKWLYLPSSKQTRRLAATSSESTAILGSELNTEDFNINTDSSAKNILQKEVNVEGKTFYQVESDVNTVSGNYSKVVSLVSADNFLPTKSECYDKQGKLLKVIDFSDYKKVGSGKWRAGKIKILNVQNNRGTEIALSNIKVDQNLKPSEFTPKALSEE